MSPRKYPIVEEKALVTTGFIVNERLYSRHSGVFIKYETKS